MRITANGQTDIGKVRKNNEDTFFVHKDLNFFIVCDGVGGAADGEVAAQKAVDTVVSFLEEKRETLEKFTPSQEGYDSLKEMLKEAVVTANKKIYEETNLKFIGMGTTLTMLLFAGDRAITAHVGDSRIYLIRNGLAHTMTDDHTVANDMFLSGMISYEESLRHRFSNVLTRVVGSYPEVKVESLSFNIFENDVFLVCSDGLSRYLPDISKVAGHVDVNNIEGVPSKLIKFANDKGGKDNITVVAVKVDAVKSAHTERTQKKISSIKKIPIFSNLSLKRTTRILNETEVLYYEPGEVVLEKDAICSGLYYLMEGEFLVEGGKNEYTLSAGSFFGEKALFKELKSPVSLKATKNSHVLALKRKKFKSLTRRFPKLGKKLLNNCIGYLLQDTNKINL